MTSTTTAAAAVAALTMHGIDTLYTVPGVHNDPLLDALYGAADRIRTVHARHEQGAAYMALGAALATGRPSSFAVVPGPGFLNTTAALLTAYSMNAPVLGLVGQIPEAEIGLGRGHLHEIRDQTGIIARLVDHTARIRKPEEAAPFVHRAVAAMRTGRPGPAVLECAMDVWGRTADLPALPQPEQPAAPAIDEDAVRAAARLLGRARNPVIFVGGGAMDAAAEVAALSAMLQAPVASGFRRGRGVLTSRDPLSATHPLAHELWGEADVVLAVGTRLFFQCRDWGTDDDLAIVHVNADPEEPARHGTPAVALVGDAAPILRRLLDLVPAENRARPSRRAEMADRQAALRARLAAALGPQLAFLDAIRAALPDDGVVVDEVTQIGFAARLAFPVYGPRTFLSPGYQDNLGWGYATALGVQDARRDVPVLSINGDGGFMYTANELATAVRHRIPLVAIVFDDGAFGNVRRIQEEQFGNRLIACDLANPDFVKFAESFGAVAERARTPEELGAALARGFARRDGPTLITVPVGPMPSPWRFIHLPRVRGG
ncbi:putative 2-ketoarginine decarboxylase AruI [Rhodoplanes serenus]|uniref:2-ketoarginine decarboxylase AruI n=1 Tax=Rhodoplanes serenus TaxID=200615 RepID=A0A3S4B6U1_9BRAD|nr:thiamine pyrophosphate-dependent enzyme [Rhodoplanes serenus]VCU10584.1 putative 2-ketoarginine decarboxylase AruI [Rhodoplanes serenus]